MSILLLQYLSSFLLVHQEYVGISVEFCWQCKWSQFHLCIARDDFFNLFLLKRKDKTLFREV